MSDKRYPVLYCDPPWYSMSEEDLWLLPVPAATDVVVFLWAGEKGAKFPETLRLMEAWGFSSGGYYLWLKRQFNPTTGDWHYKHELLLVGTRGRKRLPTAERHYNSLITDVPSSEIGGKPPAFAEIIEDMFPHAALVELFAIEPRLGWDSWPAIGSS